MQIRTPYQPKRPHKDPKSWICKTSRRGRFFSRTNWQRFRTKRNEAFFSPYNNNQKTLTRHTPSMMINIFRVRCTSRSSASDNGFGTAMYELSIIATFSVSCLYCIPVIYDYFVLRINTINHGDEQTNTEREKQERRMRKIFFFFPKGIQRVESSK